MRWGQKVLREEAEALEELGGFGLYLEMDKHWEILNRTGSWSDLYFNRLIVMQRKYCKRARVGAGRLVRRWRGCGW